jgi:hypothetical protein
LFAPAPAYRFRWSKYTDTPIPPDEPWAENPPDGAIIDYTLGPGTTGDATLQILEPGGRVVRTYSSRDTSMAPADLGNTPAYWIRRTRVLSAAPGFHRFVWDLHYAPPAGTSALPGQYPISATPHNTPREPRGPWVVPGQYTVRLTVGGRSYTAPLTVTMDPRIKTPAAIIAQEHSMAMSLYDDIARDSAIAGQVRVLRSRVVDARGRVGDAAVGAALGAYDDKLSALLGQGGGGRRGGGRGGPAAGVPSLSSVNGELLAMMALLEQADVEPTTQAVAAVQASRRDFDALAGRWNALRTTELETLNARLRAAGQPAIAAAP